MLKILDMPKIICWRYLICQKLYAQYTLYAKNYMIKILDTPKIICSRYLICQKLYAQGTWYVKNYMLNILDMSKIICSKYSTCRKFPAFIFTFIFMFYATGLVLIYLGYFLLICGSCKVQTLNKFTPYFRKTWGYFPAFRKSRLHNYPDSGDYPHKPCYNNYVMFVSLVTYRLEFTCISPFSIAVNV
jgi:hypothetical protein